MALTRLLIAALAVCSCLAWGATVRLRWESVPDAVEYVVWSGPLFDDAFTGVAFTTNTAHAVSNLTRGEFYRFAVAAYTRTNGSELAVLTAKPLETVLHLEWSSGVGGPWTGRGSNVVDAEPGFYRLRIE